MPPRHQRNLSRRKLITALAGAAVAVPVAAVIAPHALATKDPAKGNSKAAGALPLTIVNNSGSFANTSVRVYVVGNQDGRQVRLTPEGTLAPISLSDNGADGFTDYSIPLSGSGETTLSLPYMSGRIYVALGDKLKIKAVADGNGNAALQYPAGWVTSDPNYTVLHDCAEFTHNAAGMFCNTTMVDMFSVPMSIGLTGAKNQTTGSLRDGGRAQAFAAVSRIPEFADLVLDDRRIVAPGHGLDSGIFAEDYFDPYIDEVWSTYTGKDLTVTTNAGTFTGRLRGDRFVFDGPASVSFDRPSTRDVLFCDGKLAAPNDGTTGPVAAVLGAGFNRSTLISDPAQPTADPAAFYRSSQITNHYSAAIHAATEEGKAYGFAFDDVADFASYIQDTAPKGARLTLTPF
ncbi:MULTISPECIES: beta-1,3-glucanase family protein [Streptomyces]|uniref:beta-1,3-glucanase family protein n=1 Tax=Streptomyces TaxID=1883 RepID=UPI0004C4E85A|nr:MULTISPECIES: beta-1,3-glucanase family protein [Streptomyces]MCY1655475.1 beta-1,3-glucanase family protein [Streptomyces sp. SL203]MCY1677175.1 beta-1,3-glucanase family protein [Streptomyces sp. SL294]MDF6066704.1 beta-1,3-glucanase family protein [Streptomyces sp. JH010]MDX2622560.1 beta-1,3-glucanase family protein [Streptomyces sp. WI03-5b]WSZ52241.1 beta-1,3-glucanase family protein [[Kitasatospora] papulosa]